MGELGTCKETCSAILNGQKSKYFTFKIWLFSFYIYHIEIKSVKKWPPSLSPLNENKTQVTSQFMKGHEVATRLTGRKLGPLELMGPLIGYSDVQLYRTRSSSYL